MWNNGTPDKNGNDPMVLIPLGGLSPRGLNVISGTSAELQGFVAGKCYIVNAIERPDEGFGRQFNFSSIAEVNPFEALDYAKTEPVKVVIQKADATVVEETVAKEVAEQA